jgi:signal transduction histidine kinase
MLRGFRHRLLLRLGAGILVSGGIALAVQPQAWPAIVVCTAGSLLAALVCGRIARRYLQANIGRLRRVAEDIGRGRPAPPLDAAPAGDLYKLTAAVNLLATRLGEAREEEARLQEQLRRRERLAFLGELAATVAHEVNNPLDGVQNCVRILRRSADDPQRAQQMLDLIDGGLGRIELIVRRLLTLARQHVIRPSETRLGDVIDGAVRALTPTLEERGIRLVRQADVDNDRALVDAPLLEQVFVNLMTNAADSMAGGGELTIAVRREAVAAAGTEGEAAVLRIDVADTGTGIPPEALPHIFEPFFTTKPGGKGTGLGLAIAARIVDAHRGALSVAPRAGGGTVFTVRIPALAASAVHCT